MNNKYVQKLKDYLGLIVTVVSLMGGLGGFFMWADANLASKSDIEAAVHVAVQEQTSIVKEEFATKTQITDELKDVKKYHEFRMLELQITLNEYIIREMEKDGDLDTLDRARVYNNLVDTTAELTKARNKLLREGAIIQ